MRGRKSDTKKMYANKVMPKINARNNEKMGNERDNTKTQAAYKRFRRPAYYLKGDKR